MIYTITLTPAIEKRIIGIAYDELRFEPKQFSYHAGGVGIKTSLYLKKANIDSVAAYVCGRNEVSLYKETLASNNIEAIALETNIKTPNHNFFIDQHEEVTLQKEKTQSINDVQLALFSAVVQDKMQDASTVVFEYKDTTISTASMQTFYTTLAKKSECIICDIHPKYYEILSKRRADILLVHKSSLLNYINEDHISLDKTIKVLQEDIVPLSKMVIYMSTPTDFIVFYKGNIYHILSMVKTVNENIYADAILSALVESLEKDYDFESLCKEVLIASVASNIGDGMYTATPLSKEKIMNTIHLYTM